MSLTSTVRKQLRLLRYRGRWVEGTAGYDWARINHNRIEIINRAVCQVGINQCRYLEIGCASDGCFNSIIAAHKVGVDPARGGTVRATSDQFFASNQDVFDVIFVDELHTYGQARRDAVNGLARLPVGGWMFFHDMLPNSWREEAPAPIDAAWVGDVWKLGVDLAATVGVTYRTVIADHGVGALRKIAQHPSLPEALKADQRDFAYFMRARDKMNLINFEDYVAFFDECAGLGTPLRVMSAR